MQILYDYITTRFRWFTFSLLASVFLLIPHIVYSQPADLQFEHLTTHDGLSQDIITCVYRDRFGFLWIGTEDGLNRYDGYSIATYKHNPRDSNTLRNNRITGICDYGSEDMLVTTDGGFSIYHRARNTFTKPDGKLGKYAAMVSAKPLRDKAGWYWIVVNGRKLLRYDPVRDSIAFFDPLSLPQDQVKDMMIDNEDSLWVTSENAVSVFQGDAAGFLHYKIKHQQGSAHRQIVNAFTQKDADGNLWIGTNAGLYRYNRNTDVTMFVPLSFTIGTSVVDHDNIVGGLCWDLRGRLWLGGFNGLYCFNPKTNTTSRYAHYPNNPMSLQSNRVYNVSLDASNVLWVGTWWGRVSKADLKKERFGHVRHSTTTPLARESNDVTAIYEYPDGTFGLVASMAGLRALILESVNINNFLTIRVINSISAPVKSHPLQETHREISGLRYTRT